MTWVTQSDLGSVDQITSSYLNQGKDNDNFLLGGGGQIKMRVGEAAVWGAFTAGVWAEINALINLTVTPVSQYVWVGLHLPVYASVADTRFYLSFDVNGTIIRSASKGVGQFGATYASQANAEVKTLLWPISGLNVGVANTIKPVIQPQTNTISIDVVNQYAMSFVKEVLAGG